MLSLKTYIASNGVEILYTGTPDFECLDTLVQREGDIWHSSLNQGYKNTFPEIIYQTAVFFWYAKDFDGLKTSVSWRINPNAFAVRKEVWETVGGFDYDYENIQTSAFDFGFNLLRYQGAIPLFVDGLFETKHEQVQISIQDVYTFYKKNFKHSQGVYMLLRRGIWNIHEFKSYRFAKNNHSYKHKKNVLSPRVLKPITGQPTVSYIIPTMMRQAFTINLLNDLENQTYKPHQVVVVDATPEDQRDQSLYNRHFSFDLIVRWQTSKGSCRARNEAITLCSGDYIVFGDDDIRIQPHFIENHIRLLQTYKAEACNGFDIRADHQQQDLKDLDTKLKALGEKRWKVGAAQSFSNANSCVTRRVVEQLGGNDINYDGGYGEDADFGLSISKLGVTVLQNPFSVNLHLKPPVGGYRFWGKQASLKGKKRKQQPWELDKPVRWVVPKPSPTIMYQLFKHFTKDQRREYKIKYFVFYFTKARRILLPLRFLVWPWRMLQFNRSEFYAKQLMALGKRIK
ncbi:glycosyltransferase family 2 protein [Tamlana fucoidanivorans]|uniref:Glycosyltransferase family 2 protein n=1 Tax=Allotamlana fucoidanivorans TaxID=2583814 RepID=A0A5C4SPL7_9FLAO|nr:glycosyltransferase family A protein [Tamlana fucoidanivorans]TNJ45753.1 glycosyltransferase family 2 protein [Tamlana fucoidanivorans]